MSQKNENEWNDSKTKRAKQRTKARRQRRKEKKEEDGKTFHKMQDEHVIFRPIPRTAEERRNVESFLDIRDLAQCFRELEQSSDVDIRCFHDFCIRTADNRFHDFTKEGYEYVVYPIHNYYEDDVILRRKSAPVQDLKE